MSREVDERVRRVLQQYSDHLNPSWVRGYKFLGVETLEVEAQGAIILDAYGREYLDFACGPAVFIVGHRHPKVVEAARRELGEVRRAKRAGHAPAPRLAWAAPSPRRAAATAAGRSAAAGTSVSRARARCSMSSRRASRS